MKQYVHKIIIGMLAILWISSYVFDIAFLGIVKLLVVVAGISLKPNSYSTSAFFPRLLELKNVNYCFAYFLKSQFLTILQVAQKFYSLLVLKKFQVLDLEQLASYEDIEIMKGVSFNNPTM